MSQGNPLEDMNGGSIPFGDVSEVSGVMSSHVEDQSESLEERENFAKFHQT